jgi:hypothetical protein
LRRRPSCLIENGQDRRRIADHLFEPQPIVQPGPQLLDRFVFAAFLQTLFNEHQQFFGMYRL